MLAIVSPKETGYEPARALALPEPASLMGDTEQLVKTAKRLKPDDLRSLMGISESLATLNHERFQSFTTPFTPENAKPAALMFNGDTYTDSRPALSQRPTWTGRRTTWPSSRVSTASFAPWTSSSPTDSRWAPS